MVDARRKQASRLLRESSRTVALTGAGISTASGVPDFRGKEGIWERYDPDRFTLQHLRSRPGDFWEAFASLQEELFAKGPFEPNPAHEALAELVRRDALETIVTQNVDRLHEEAGTDPDRVLHLHGRNDFVVCLECDRQSEAEPVIERVRTGKFPPRCDRCSGLLKPGGVLFGEPLPRDKHLRAHALAESCDLFLVAGSSLTVEPAASLPVTAHRKGATVITVNLDPTPLRERARFAFRDDVTDVLPDLVRGLESAGS